MAKRIYVADDELHIRTLIQTFLANEGYEVETFEDGNSLFEAFHASCPDLIILDVMMPGMDGFALCTAIRRESRVPIIIVTDNESLCLEGYDVPIFQFYTKAMTVQQMRMVLESLMDHAPDMGNRFFIFSSDQSMYQVRLSDITFFEANRSSLFIHTTQKSYACRDTLKNLQTRLRRFPFERIHKSFIVNTKFISCLQSDSLILQDGTVLPVSKHKMAPMRHYLKLLMESSLL